MGPAFILLICLPTILSAADLKRARFASATASKHVSSCKKNSNEAYQLCHKELAITDKGRLACAKQYVTTFPKCFFPAVISGRSCGRIVLNSYSRCVMESPFYGEIFACNNMKDKMLKSCNSKPMEDETEASSIYEKRGNVQACNHCATGEEVCFAIAATPPEYDLCLEASESCKKEHNCHP